MERTRWCLTLCYTPNDVQWKAEEAVGTIKMDLQCTPYVVAVCQPHTMCCNIVEIRFLYTIVQRTKLDRLYTAIALPAFLHG